MEEVKMEMEENENRSGKDERMGREKEVMRMCERKFQRKNSALCDLGSDAPRKMSSLLYILKASRSTSLQK